MNRLPASHRACRAGRRLFDIFAILDSAPVALYQSIVQLIDPQPLKPPGARRCRAVGLIGNEVAAFDRLGAGRRLDSPSLIADGYHARTDGLVSLGVIASALVVSLGLDIADPLIGLAITVIIRRTTWHSWQTIRAG